jgi:hypothetical protein
MAPISLRELVVELPETLDEAAARAAAVRFSLGVLADSPEPAR